LLTNGMTRKKRKIFVNFQPPYGGKKGGGALKPSKEKEYGMPLGGKRVFYE